MWTAGQAWERLLAAVSLRSEWSRNQSNGSSGNTHATLRLPCSSFQKTILCVRLTNSLEMKRRSFIQIASAALAGIPLASKLFARKPRLPGTTWGGLVTSSDFGKVGAYFDLRPRPIVKVTGVWKRHGFESAPHDCEVNESAYIELPKICSPHVMIGGAYGDSDVQWHEINGSVLPDVYRVYAPLRGFEKTGPWYFLKQVRHRDAKQARFTIAVDYQDHDLIPVFPTQYHVRFPESAPAQTHWMMYGGERPIGIFPT